MGGESNHCVQRSFETKYKSWHALDYIRMKIIESQNSLGWKGPLKAI